MRRYRKQVLSTSFCDEKYAIDEIEELVSIAEKFSSLELQPLRIKMDDKLQIITKMKRTIEYIDKSLDNYPHRHIELKNKI